MLQTPEACKSVLLYTERIDYVRWCAPHAQLVTCNLHIVSNGAACTVCTQCRSGKTQVNGIHPGNVCMFQFAELIAGNYEASQHCSLNLVAA